MTLCNFVIFPTMFTQSRCRPHTWTHEHAQVAMFTKKLPKLCRRLCFWARVLFHLLVDFQSMGRNNRVSVSALILRTVCQACDTLHILIEWYLYFELDECRSLWSIVSILSSIAKNKVLSLIHILTSFSSKSQWNMIIRYRTKFDWNVFSINSFKIGKNFKVNSIYLYKIDWNY